MNEFMLYLYIIIYITYIYLLHLHTHTHTYTHTYIYYYILSYPNLNGFFKCLISKFEYLTSKIKDFFCKSIYIYGIYNDKSSVAKRALIMF